MPNPTNPDQARIAKGMALLDQHAPGWERRIVLSLLDQFDAYT